VKSYEAASRDKSQATLTVREKSYGKRIPVPETNWEFAASSKDPSTGKETIKPSSKDLYLHEGFKPGHIYEFIYPAKNPLVLGLGFAVTRDLISFLRYESKDAIGKPNPLASSKKSTGIDHAYAWGRSQSGRYLRDFVYHGFNEDESHRKVFDAIAPHVAGGGRLYLNHEFARPVTSSQQHTNQLDPELFPHAYNVIKDAQTGRRDGILKRPRTDPLVFHTQTSTEYWQKRGCLAHTDGKGNDLRIPNNVRIYVIASAQHNSPFGSEPVKDGTQQRINPLPAGETGEIEAKGAAVMLGYWNNPKANAETLKDGWLRTGDVGRLDEDGFLTLSDRSKDVIISGGTNIYPREVEEALLTHADVREVSAIGVPDADWGEIVVACVVLEEGAAANDQTLDAHCLTSIARFKRPKRYVYLDALPKNNYGKVLKTELRKMMGK